MIESAREFIRLRSSENMDEYLRAANESATEEVWLEVIREYPEMKEWVAHNKTTSQRILKFLAEDSDPKVRWMVATRRSAGEEILRKLAYDPDETVRARVASNPKVSSDILLELLNDQWERVVEIAKKRLKKDGIIF